MTRRNRLERLEQRADLRDNRKAKAVEEMTDAELHYIAAGGEWGHLSDAELAAIAGIDPDISDEELEQRIADCQERIAASQATPSPASEDRQ